MLFVGCLLFVVCCLLFVVADFVFWVVVCDLSFFFGVMSVFGCPCSLTVVGVV